MTEGEIVEATSELDRHRELLDSLFDAAYYVDKDRKIVYWNKAAETLTGYKAVDVLGKHCWDKILMHVDDQGTRLCGTQCPLAATIRDGRPCEANVYLHHQDGHRVPVSVRASPLRDPTGEIAGAIEMFTDNSAQAALTERVEELESAVLLDPLTELGNRRHIEMSLRERLAEMDRYGSPFGVLFVDIDHFKAVNDTYGHDMGDDVLKMVAKTLALNLRPFDNVGRWGGEEFVALVAHTDEGQVRSAAERCRALVEQSSLPAGADSIRVTISIGATLAVPGDTKESLLKRADQLMYQSKTNGRNCVATTLDGSMAVP